MIIKLFNFFSHKLFFSNTKICVIDLRCSFIYITSSSPQISVIYHLLEASNGKTKKMEIKQHYINSPKTVHGGAIFALADNVFAIALYSYGTVEMAISVSISYFTAVKGGILTAETKESSNNLKLASYSKTVINENSYVMAIFQGMVYIKKRYN